MPAPPPAPSPPSVVEIPQVKAALGSIRAIRAEAQFLLGHMREVAKKAKLTDSKTRDKEVSSYLEANVAVFKKNLQQVDGRLVELDGYQKQNPRIYDWCSDEATAIDNTWDTVKARWPQEDQTLDEISARTSAVIDALQEIIMKCGLLTIPPRADQHLESLRVGQALDFHEAFKDELDDESKRKDILRYIRAHPRALTAGGLVDVENGMIYRASPDPGRQLLSYFLIGWFLLGGAIILVMLSVLGSGLSLQDWPVTEDRLPELLGAYLFLTAGAFVHIGIDVLKQARKQKASSFSALGNVFIWIHVKETPIIVGVVTLWIGILGLAFTMQGIQWPLAFFVGYSIDSFVDLFIGKFETKVSAGIEEAKKTIGEKTGGSETTS